MMIIDMGAAAADFAGLVERACAGEEVIITRNSEPVVKLVPIRVAQPKRVFGSMKGQFRVPSAFFEPLPDGELETWDQ